MSRQQRASYFPGAGTWNISAVARIAADWLCLAAAPCFAAMAFATDHLDRAAPDALCITPRMMPLSGMASMYLLMSLFHIAPWLRLISARRYLPRHG